MTSLPFPIMPIREIEALIFCHSAKHPQRLANFALKNNNFLRSLLGIKYTNVVPPIKLVTNCSIVMFKTINPIVPSPSAPKIFAFRITIPNIINIVRTLEKKVDKMFPNIK